MSMSLENLFLKVFEDEAEILERKKEFFKGYMKTQFDYIMKGKYNIRLYFVKIFDWKRPLTYNQVLKLRHSIIKVIRSPQFRFWRQKHGIEQFIPIGVIITNDVSTSAIKFAFGDPQIWLITRGLLISSLREKKIITMNEIARAVM